MVRPRPQWQLQAIAAQKRDNELRRAEELQKVATYFEKNTNKSRHHETWTTQDYYVKAQKDAELLSKKKIQAVQLEERRKKLEFMLFQENMQYQQELKALAAQPKFYKNGSYLNQVSTSTLQEINQGIMDKEEQLRKQEAELKLYHAWRLRQPELRAASSYMANGKLKSAWLEQIVEKEIQNKKDQEETRKILQERDAALQKQILIEEDKLREKELKVKELKQSLESQMSEFSEKESAVKDLRKMEERERMILEELQFLSNEREKEHAKIVAERDANIVNMGLHKFKLKKKVASILSEISLDLKIMEKIKEAVVKDYESEKEKRINCKRLLDAALVELEQYRERERQRQKNIDTMYDGEARQLNEKQDKIWTKEREARSVLIKEVIATLKKQVEEKIKLNIEQQRGNVLEREKILEEMDSFHQEVRSREKESLLNNTSHSSINALQSQLNSLKVQKEKMEAIADRESAIREEISNEKRVRFEIARAQREGNTHAWS